LRSSQKESLLLEALARRPQDRKTANGTVSSVMFRDRHFLHFVHFPHFSLVFEMAPETKKRPQSLGRCSLTLPKQMSEIGAKRKKLFCDLRESFPVRIVASKAAATPPDAASSVRNAPRSSLLGRAAQLGGAQ
jgi:hypothetical protein